MLFFLEIWLRMGGRPTVMFPGWSFLKKLGQTDCRVYLLLSCRDFRILNVTLWFHIMLPYWKGYVKGHLHQYGKYEISYLHGDRTRLLSGIRRSFSTTLGMTGFELANIFGIGQSYQPDQTALFCAEFCWFVVVRVCQSFLIPLEPGAEP